MAYNFKSLADVELLKSTSDGVNLIAEDGGKIVKVAAESLVPEDVARKSDVDTLSKEIADLKGGGSGDNLILRYGDNEEYTASMNYADVVEALQSGTLGLVLYQGAQVSYGKAYQYVPYEIQYLPAYETNGAIRVKVDRGEENLHIYWFPDGTFTSEWSDQ